MYCKVIYQYWLIFGHHGAVHVGWLHPVVEEISKDFEGKIKVFKLNTDENPNVASQYGIRSIPTLMIFKGGQKVDTVVGAVPKATLSSTLTKHL